jgi:DNA primase
VNAPRTQIPDSFIQDVLARVDIVETVGRVVQLKKGGANLLGLCPFHGEKSPSFTVSPAKQFYHCFGCGAHGDAIRFMMEHAGMGFVDAVRDLAQQVGLKLPEVQLDPAEQARQDAAQQQRRGITDVMERAAEHYRQRLKQSPRAVDYLKQRGLSGEIARDFGLGYAPDGWKNLASAFGDYGDPLLVEAGLVIAQGEAGEEQKRYDRFRDRIMFPIRSTRGEVIGFGGRVIDQGEPKYLNSPETPVFVKGRELYGLYESRTGIRERGYALVVEGYMDVVALAQSEFRNAVATLGTACTTEHVQKLLRFTDQVVFSFDGDAAGRRAAARALEATLPQVNDLRSFRFLFLPAEHDPDSFIRAVGASAFEQAVAAAKPLSRMLIDTASDGADLTTAEGRARLLAQAKPLWQALPETALLRSQILGELAETARMDSVELNRLWGSSGSPARRQPARPDTGGASARAASASPAPFGKAPRTGISRLAIRGPEDQVARMLLLHAALWEELSMPDHELLTSLQSWHGELFRWLERELHDQGAAEWPVLRERLAGQAVEGEARALVDGTEIHEAPNLGNLRPMVDRIRQQPTRRLNHQILTSLGPPRRR